MLAGWWCNGEKVTGCLQESIRFLLFWAPTCTVNRSSAAILVTVSQTDRRLEATTWKTLINEMKRILCLHWLDLKFDPAQKTHKVKCASTNWTLAASYPQNKQKGYVELWSALTDARYDVWCMSTAFSHRTIKTALWKRRHANAV